MQVRCPIKPKVCITLSPFGYCKYGITMCVAPVCELFQGGLCTICGSHVCLFTCDMNAVLKVSTMDIGRKIPADINLLLFVE